MKTPEIKILIGATGAGKSTFAEYWLRTEPNWMRVSRDDFRMMNFSNTNLAPEDESKITEMVDGSITALINKGVNVLVDATHCRAEYINTYIDKYIEKAHISFKVFDVELDELKKRCKKRFEETGRFIPEKVTEKYFKELQFLKSNFDFSTRKRQPLDNILIAQNEALPKAIICDLDGTLALMNGRNPFDASKCDEDLLNVPVANVLKNYHQLGYKILLVSGREDKFQAPTLRFLEKHQIPFDELLMRKTKDSRKDSIIKKEIYKEHIVENYFVEFVLDDRNQVVDTWRKELHLPCFQVFYGDF
ncbi:AAA family ATPase [Flavobacterium oreochromis]|uniref:phosphatase domain-containing protein n=1 Tax=Flavobacterium oreochromis TaxID=2906078 RepID=UPI00385A59D5